MQMTLFPVFIFSAILARVQAQLPPLPILPQPDLTDECQYVMDAYRQSQLSFGMYLNPGDPFFYPHHSTGQGDGQFGNIDQCVMARGEYCTVMKLLDTFVMGVQFSGCCVPPQCTKSPQDIPALIEICDPQLYYLIEGYNYAKVVNPGLAANITKNLPPAVAYAFQNFTTADVPIACGHDTSKKADVGAHLLWVLVGTIVVLVAVASGADYLSHVYMGSNKKSDGKESLPSDTMPGALKAFSFQKNWHALMDRPDRPTNFLDGIRAFSYFWVVLGHSYSSGQSQMFGTDNFTALRQDSSYMWFNMMVASGLFSVDTFFWLGGFLFAYLFAKKLNKMKNATVNAVVWAPIIYVQRWLRLVPTVLFCTLVAWKWLPLWVSGNVPSGTFDNIPQVLQDMAAAQGAKIDPAGFTPVPSYYEHAEDCKDGWWVHILFLQTLNNHYSKKAGACMGHLWYLSAEFEIVWFTPIVFFLYTLHPFGGYLASFVGIWVGIGNSIETTQTNKLAPFGLTDAKFFPKYYLKPWTRCGVYFVGFWLGLICTDLEARAKARKYKMKIGAVMSSILQLIGCGTLLFLDMIMQTSYPDGLFPELFGKKAEWTQAGANAWNGLARPLWGVGLSLLCFSLLYGPRKGVIASFLEWPLWNAIGKLSFAAYVIHFPLFDLLGANATQKDHYSRFPQLEKWLGHTFVSLFAAFCMWFIIEAPFANLAKLFLQTIQAPCAGGNKKRGEPSLAGSQHNGKVWSKPLLEGNDAEGERQTTVEVSMHEHELSGGFYDDSHQKADKVHSINA